MPLPPIRTLAGKWLLAAFLFLAAGIGALWYSALSAYESAVLRERGRELQAIAELKIEFIHFWLNERRSDALVQSRRPLLAIALTGVDADKWPYGLAALPGQLDAIRKEYGYESVLLLDRDGTHGFSAGAGGDDARAAAAKAAQASMAEGRVVISRAYHAESDGRQHVDIDIAAPIVSSRLAGTQAVGALVFHLDPRAHLDPFLSRWPAPSASGESFLFERDGEEIVFLSSLRHADAAQLRRRVDDPALPAALAARGGQGVVEGLDYRGVPVVAAVGQVPGMPWFVVSKLDRDEVLAPVRREALWSGALASLLALALGLAMLAWHRRGQSELALAQQAAAKAALAASEARFRRLHEHGWDFNILFDRGMVMRFASPSIDRLLGRQAIGHEITAGTAKVHPDDVARVEAARQAALKQPGKPQFVTHRLAGEAGGWLSVEACFTNFFDDPDIAAMVYTARDISERKLAETKLKESEERLRAIFECAPVGIAIADAEGRYAMINPAQCRMLGYGEEELIGRSFAEFTHREDAQANLDVTALVRSGTTDTVSLEKRYVRKDGSLFWVLLTVARISGAEGELIGTVGIAQDITERREAEAQRLEHLRRQRDTLVREVHHRIKNHLQGLTGLINQYKQKHPALQEALDAVIAQITAISLIHGLQSREADNDVRLFRLLREIVSFHSGLAALEFANAGKAYCLDCAWRIADEECVPLALVLNELLTNAVKHQDRPAPVRIACACNDAGIVVTLHNAGRLPPGFDFNAGAGLGTGLTLLRSLLPRSGAALSFSCTDGQVETRLALSAPVVSRQGEAQVVSLR